MNEIPINEIINGNCVEVMKEWPDECIDMVIFSTPYYGLRDYGESTNAVWGGDENCEHEWVESDVALMHENRNFQLGTQEDVHGGKPTTFIKKYDTKTAGFCSKCGAWRGQLGLEPTWQMYIDHMAQICREIWRVLKKSGSMYINIGDTYAGSNCARGDKTLFQNPRRQKIAGNVYDKAVPQAKNSDYRPKCLMGIPWRLAFALINDGWILRNDIIWHKPNAMPSSVKDRLSNRYEHIFHFVKSKKYYYNLDFIREPIKSAKNKTSKNGNGKNRKYKYNDDTKQMYNPNRVAKYRDKMRELGLPEGHPYGKNPGDVWSITTMPFKDAHFAVYPLDLVVRPILSSCPHDGVVLDPFAGSGTTFVACEMINRHMWEDLRYEPNEAIKKTEWNIKWIGIEINPEYIKIAMKRLGKFINAKKLDNFIDENSE